jgi:hypothetical protein
MVLNISPVKTPEEQYEEEAEQLLQDERQNAQREQRIFDLFDKMYEYTDKEKVIGFLKQHRELWEILLGAPRQLRKHFGSPLRLTLHLFVDPEHPVEKKITVYFATKLNIEERLAAWEKFGEEWWWEYVDEHLEYIHFHDIAWREE